MVSSYATAKAGVESLGRSLRAELAPYGAGASVAYFGFIDTKMVQEGFSHPLAERLEEVAAARDRTPPSPARRAPAGRSSKESRSASLGSSPPRGGG